MQYCINDLKKYLFLYILLFIGCNFVLVSPSYAEEEYPVPIIFVHGLESTSASWKKVAKFLCDTKGLRPGGDLIIEDGNKGYKLCHFADDVSGHKTDLMLGDFYTVQFTNNNSLSFEEQGIELKRAIDFISSNGRGNPSVKYCLVGHSMGGLAIRSYLGNYGVKNVSGVISINTPHLGSALARFNQIDTRNRVEKTAKSGTKELAKKLASLNLNSKAIKYLKPEGFEINQLLKANLPTSIPYVSIIGDWKVKAKKNSFTKKDALLCLIPVFGVTYVAGKEIYQELKVKGSNYLEKGKKTVIKYYDKKAHKVKRKGKGLRFCLEQDKNFLLGDEVYIDVTRENGRIKALFRSACLMERRNNQEAAKIVLSKGPEIVDDNELIEETFVLSLIEDHNGPDVWEIFGIKSGYQGKYVSGETFVTMGPPSRYDLITASERHIKGTDGIVSVDSQRLSNVSEKALYLLDWAEIYTNDFHSDATDNTEAIDEALTRIKESLKAYKILDKKLFGDNPQIVLSYEYTEFLKKKRRDIEISDDEYQELLFEDNIYEIKIESVKETHELSKASQEAPEESIDKVDGSYSVKITQDPTFLSAMRWIMKWLIPIPFPSKLSDDLIDISLQEKSANNNDVIESVEETNRVEKKFQLKFEDNSQKIIFNKKHIHPNDGPLSFPIFASRSFQITNNTDMEVVVESSMNMPPEIGFHTYGMASPTLSVVVRPNSIYATIIWMEKKPGTKDKNKFELFFLTTEREGLQVIEIETVSDFEN